MTTVREDLIRGSRSRQNSDGWEIERVFLVEGLDGDAPAKMVNAVTATGIPALGSPHPTVPTVFLKERFALPHTTDAIEVHCVYRQTSEAQSHDPYNATIEVGSAVTQDSTNQDVNKNTIEVTIPETTKKQPSMVPILIPQTTVVAHRQENFSPLQKSKQYVGKVNSGGWAVDPGAADRTWLCTRITGTSNDSGDTYTVTYEFAHKTAEGEATGWDAYVVAMDTAEGFPHAGVNHSTGAGTATFQIYHEIDFGGLGL